MSLGKKLGIPILSLILITTGPFAAGSPDGAGAVKVSGGEDHTLVRTAAKTVWACGDNSYYQLGIGDTGYVEYTLIRVHGPNDVNYLEDINNVDAGWLHSLALDVNGFVWAWGDNTEGQSGTLN